MATVKQLARYPFTGGRAELLNELTIGPGGVQGDRVAVLYDPNDVNEDGSFARVGQKRYPQLATVTAGFYRTGTLWVSYPKGRLASVAAPPDGEIIRVDEFGQRTPCRDAGNFAADCFSALVGKEVRVGVKTKEWLDGGGLPAEERATAALHVIVQESADAIGAGDRTDRFRANVVLEGLPPNIEVAEWIGRLVAVGPLVVKVSAAAPRCEQTGNNQQTGEYVGDIPKLFPDMPRDPTDGRSPAFGIYAYLVEGPGGQEATVKVGDEVHLLDTV